MKFPTRTGDISFDYNSTLDCAIENLEAGFSKRQLIQAGFSPRDVNTALEIIQMRGGLGENYFSSQE